MTFLETNDMMNKLKQGKQKQTKINNDAWLSLVERCVRDAEVAGSNPVASISLAGAPGAHRSDEFPVLFLPGCFRLLISSNFSDIMRQNTSHVCYIYEYSKEEDLSLDIAQVYNDNKNSVYRLAFTYLHSRAEAEDICHNVFIKMIEHKASVFPGKEKAWLLTVTANECKN